MPRTRPKVWLAHTRVAAGARRLAGDYAAAPPPNPNCQSSDACATGALVTPEAGREPLQPGEWAALSTDLKRVKWLDERVIALAAAIPALGLQRAEV
eukprot:771163-Prymnesium_polylepis.1